MPPSNLSELLKKIRQATNVIATADSKSKAEEDDLARQQKRAEISGFQQDIEERKKYAGRAFWLVVIWLALIGLIVIFQGFGIGNFALPNSVLITLIGSTTGSVVGIFLIVTRYLFKTR